MGGLRGINWEGGNVKRTFPTNPGLPDALASTLTAVCGVFRRESGPFEDGDYLKGEFFVLKSI